MTSENGSTSIGIEEARGVLGDLVTSAQEGADVILTRHRRPVARIVRYKEVPTVTVTDLAAMVDMQRAPEKVAQFAGCFTVHDPRTGRLPKRWQGQGMAAMFTEDEAEELAAEWSRTKRAVDSGLVEHGDLHLRMDATDAELDAETAEVRARYRP